MPQLDECAFLADFASSDGTELTYENGWLLLEFDAEVDGVVRRVRAKWRYELDEAACGDR